MARPSHIESRRALRTSVAICFFALGLALFPGRSSAEEQTTAPPPPRILAFLPGETLTYEISWSNIITAGTATMEVKQETMPDGREVLTFILTGRSTGLVDMLYHVNDTAESVFDPLIMQSLSYRLKESYGTRKRRRELVFDREQKTVVSRLNDDPPETSAVPEHVQDVLSSLYYLRTMEDFTTGKPQIIEVYDSGKNWSVEIQTLGREKVRTPAGEFAAIKVRTYPKYEGVFMNKGVVYIWLTEDSRKVPVLMKSALAVGSFVCTLTEMKPGNDAH